MPPRSKIDYCMFQQMYDSGMKQTDLAAYFQMNRTTVQKIAKRLGLKNRTTGPKRGELHPEWKGGKRIVGNYCYVYCPDHPNATKQRYVCEHRLVMEKHIGRYLDKKEVVHHKDGNPLNNHIDNLVLFQTNGEHLFVELCNNEKHREACRKGNAKRLANLKFCGSQQLQTNDHLTS